MLEVDDVTAERDRIVAAGWPLDHDLQARPWGLTDFRVLDPGLAGPTIAHVTPEHPDPTPRPHQSGDYRASDADRDAVVERLREAAAEGRIDLIELEARLDQALAAKTYAELAPLTADLPPEVPPDPGRPLVLRGGMNGAKRTGRWKVPAYVTAYGGMAGVRLDFTRALCGLPEVTVEVHGEMAGVTIVIPDGWAADTGDVEPGLGGMKDKTTPDRLPGTPLIRLTGSGGTAGVVIRHPNRWERRRLKRDEAR